MKTIRSITLICTIGFVFCSVAISQELVLISQKFCPPCRAAKNVLEKIKDHESIQGYKVREWDIAKDRLKIEGLGIGSVTRTPVLVKLDHDGNALSSITDLGEDLIKAFAADKPAKEVYKPIVLDKFMETLEEPAPSSFGAGPRIITYSIATQYKDGYYNSSFPWNDIEYAMESLARYYNLDYRRVNSGAQWQIIQANTVGGKDWAAWTNGSRTYISPVFRYYSPVQGRMIIVHERGHVGGRGHHNIVNGLMHPYGGYKLLPQDQSYFNGTPYKGSLRPEHEPEWFRTYLSKGVKGVFGEDGNDDGNTFPLLNVQAK